VIPDARVDTTTSTVYRAALVEIRRSEDLSRRVVPVESMAPLARRVRGEYEEMPGLRLTVPQAARLFGITTDVAHAVLETLRHTSVLKCSDLGQYSLAR
jgi:hypothetical protein